jgi:hypothetical protein
MIKTLYIHGDGADPATHSFATRAPITLVGIDASTGEPATCTGTVSVLEYSPWNTRYEGRQWRAVVRWGWAMPSKSSRTKAKTPNVAGLATLDVPERLLLFCVASDTDPRQAGITSRTIDLLMIKGLIRRGDNGLVLTALGFATIDALVSGRGRWTFQQAATVGSL